MAILLEYGLLPGRQHSLVMRSFLDSSLVPAEGRILPTLDLWWTQWIY